MVKRLKDESGGLDLAGYIEFQRWGQGSLVEGAGRGFTA